MNEPTAKENPSSYAPPLSAFTGPVAELIAQRMLSPPSRPGLLAVLDHFEILRVLGGGGMGIVLLARDSETGREAAIKLVKSDLVTNPQVVHRFLKEAGHLKRLRHTNIVPVQEISDRPQGAYFVMPFFEKGSLATRIKPEQPLDTESILDLATQVAEGLSFAHRSGIIHRDLKPANVLLGAQGQVCLADFGLARSLFNDTVVDVENRQLEGTAPYMSPAVAAGDAEDTRCDIYSFGSLLYEMLTGRPPYQGRGTKEILDQVLAGPPKPIPSLNPAAGRGLVAVAEKAMARELRDRYADMRDVLKDLQRIKAGQPPLGQRKTSPLGRVLKMLWIPACLAAVALLARVFWPHPIPHVPPKVLTFAGQVGVSGYTDGPRLQAQFRLPNAVAVDHQGNVYVADTANNVIRKIATNGLVSTLAGLAGSHGAANGAGTTARFWAPFGLAADASGNLYVADTANNTIRQITPAGLVRTLAGGVAQAGTNDGLGLLARFANPWSVAIDGAGNVLVADLSNDTIRKIAPSGRVTTFAGRPRESGYADGPATQARFNHPFGVATDKEGNVYVSDSANNTIRKITPGGVVRTLAGLAGYAGSADGKGTEARFSNPQGLAVDRAGNVFVADTDNGRVRRITPQGEVTTLPQADDSPHAAQGERARAQLDSPTGVAVDDAGNVYVADAKNHCVRKIVP